MAGPRYTDWTPIHITGDNPELGAPYISQARKLLGYIMSEGLGTSSIRRELEDGTVLLAEKFGDVPRITIYPAPQPEPKRPIRLLDDLVMDAGAAAWNVDQTERILPPIIAQPDKDLNWKSNFFKSSSPGYFEGAGTYSFIYNTVDKPDTKQLVGSNHTWSNADGERLSYITTFPYWAAPYRHPDSLYSFEVSHLGFSMGLLGYEGPEGDPLDEKFVMAAGMKGTWLYVMMCEGAALNYTPRPTSPTVPFQVWASDPFSIETIHTVLRRFKLKVKTEINSGVEHYVIEQGSHEDLWADDLERAYAPWVFNEDCSEVVTYRIPDNTVQKWEGGEGGVGPTVPLSTDGERLSIAIDTETGGATFSTSTAGDACAEDNDIVLRIERVTGANYDFVWGTHRIPAQRWDGSVYRSRALAYIDLKSGWAILHETEYTYSGPITSEFVYHDPDGDVDDDRYHHDLVETYQKRALSYDPTTGIETEIGTQPLISVTHPTYLGVRQYGLLEEFTYIASANPSGTALLYSLRLGIFFSSEEPAGGGIIGYESAWDAREHSHIVLSIDKDSGTSNGGYSVCQPVNDADLPLVWLTPTGAGYGPGGSIAPSHEAAESVYIHAGSASSKRWVAYSGTLDAVFYDPLGGPSGLTKVLVNYIVGGDIPAIIGSSFPDDFVPAMYVLGKPTKTQPEERE